MQPGAPNRYFPGRVPNAYVDSDSASDDDAPPSSPNLPVTSRPRKRFQARVLTSLEQDHTKIAHAPARRSQNPSAAGFVSVTKLKQGHARIVSDDSSGRDDSSSSESESQSYSEASQEIVEAEVEEEEDTFIPKPVFIRKEERVSSAEVDAQVATRQQQDETMRKQKRREEAQNIVSAILTEEDRRPEWDGAHRLHADMPDDEDYSEDEAAEYELWKEREMKRLLRDRKAEEVRLAGGKSVVEDEDQEQAAEQEKADDNASNSTRKIKVGPFFLEKGKDGKYAEAIYNRSYDVPVNNPSNRLPLSAVVLRAEAEATENDTMPEQ